MNKNIMKLIAVYNESILTTISIVYLSVWWKEMVASGYKRLLGNGSFCMWVTFKYRLK